MNRFKRNPTVEAQLGRTPQYAASLIAAAVPAQRFAQTFAKQVGAPWMPRAGARETIVIDESPSGVRLVNTDHAGHLTEFGSRNNPAHAPLRRGVRAAGLRFLADD